MNSNNLKKKENKIKVIVVTGTPATGKTTLAKTLANKLDYLYFDGKAFIEKNHIFEGKDKDGTLVVPVDKFVEKILELHAQNWQGLDINNIKIKGVIVDSHMSHYLPKEFVDLCIVTKCALKELNVRLKERGYGENKIRDNLDSEIFEVCKTEALEKGHDVLEVDTTTNQTSLDKICDKIIEH